jgi:hypothetical protein
MRSTWARVARGAGGASAPPPITAVSRLSPAADGVTRPSDIFRPSSPSCRQRSDWKKMALWYYYTFTDPWYVRIRSAKPPNPSTEPMTVNSNGDILFKFISSVYGKNVAWSYYLESRPCSMNDHDKCVAASRDAPWTRFKTLGWSAKVRAVLTSYPYGGASGCREYHVIAHGPGGNSLPPRFTRFTRQGPRSYCA